MFTTSISSSSNQEFISDSVRIHFQLIMAFSTQNKTFLALLRKLEVDLKQFPDQSFDGLFDNVPKDINYFFNWFLENITTDNVLTELEQAAYFELEKNHLLSTDDEINYTLSMCRPTFRELQSLEVNYINGFLLEELQGLNKNYKNLHDTSLNLESNHCEIKRKYNSLKESVSSRKKQFGVVKKGNSAVNSLFSSKLDNAKEFLLNEPCTRVNINLYKDLIIKEEDIFYKFQDTGLFKNEFSSSSKLVQLAKLEEDLTYVEAFLIFSQGLLKSKQTKIQFLTSVLQNKLNQRSFNESNSSDFFFSLVNFRRDDQEKTNETQILEEKLYRKIKVVSHTEIQKIMNQYLINKIDLNKIYLSKLMTCQNYMKSVWSINSWCLHIVLRNVNSLEKIFQLRKEFLLELRKTETNFSNNISNFELKRQRFKEVSAQVSQHPFLLELKNVMHLNENPENNSETLDKVRELMICGNNDLNFVNHKFRSNLQSSIKSLFNDVLCGPTSQLLFTPVDLLVKFQSCEQRDRELSHEIKRLVNKYVDAKEFVLRSDRKRFLIWVDFLTDPEALRSSLKSLEPKS